MKQAAAVSSRTVFPGHIPRVLPMRTEVKRNQTKALFAQGGCFFKELVTISVQQELHQMFKIEVYLGFWVGEEKFALLSKLIVHREMLAYFNRRDFSIRFACQH